MLGKTVKVCREIDWITENDAATEREMYYKFEEKPDPEASLRLSEILREATVGIWKQIEKGSITKDISVEHEGMFIAATPPRPYQQWKYECAKSDIVVVGPIEKKEEIIERLSVEKEKALKEKENVKRHLKPALPALNQLVLEGLADAVLGRGTYFDRNGFPNIEKDDVDIMLIRMNELSGEEEKRLIDILKTIPATTNIVKGNEYELRKVAGSTQISFVLGSKEEAKRRGGLAYQVYVLKTAKGIDLESLPAEKSEDVAKKLIEYLPKEPQMDHLPRVPPKKLLKSKS